jgi:hypothetical protein
MLGRGAQNKRIAKSMKKIPNMKKKLKSATGITGPHGPF